MQFIKPALIAGGSLFLLTALVLGQGAVGTILGIVTDTSGGVIAYADITITNVETGVAQLTKTTSEGTYTVPFLKPGLYRVTAESDGFASQTIDNVRLAVDQRVRIDAQLQPGTVTETIEVTGTALVLDTDSATVGQSVNARQVSDLPLNGRNFTNLMLLNPGTVQTGGEQLTRPGSGGAISMMGARPASNLYLLDGVANNDVIYQTAAIRPSIDAIQEFKMQTMTYSAEYGNSANQINISIKSGTNDLHGTVFEFLRNDAVDARGPFDGQTIPPLRQNQFGYTVGGPIYIPRLYDGRNKSFFFANYEGWRIRESTTSFGTVATTEEIAGRFAEPLRDPLGGMFPNSMVPSSRLSRVGGVLASVSPAPNTNIPQGNYTFVVPTPTDQNQQIYRFDHSVSNKDFLFGRYSESDFGSQQQSGLTQVANRVNVLENLSWQVNYTRTFSPTIVNQFRFGYLSALADRVGRPAPAGTVAALGLRGIYGNLEELGMSFPFTHFGGARGLSAIGGAVNVPWLNRQPTYDIWNSTSISRGAHTFSFGANVRRWRLENNVSTGYLGQWAFQGEFTGHPTADMLIGRPFEVWSTQPTAYSDPEKPGNPVNIHYLLIAPYFQDDWKVNSNLTINIGMRYEYTSLPYEENNKWGWMDPNIPGGGIAVSDRELIDSGIGGDFYSYGGSRTAGISQKRVFAPRIGIALRPFGGNKTVVRTGYGVFFDIAEGFEDVGSGNIYPYTVRSVYQGIPGGEALIADELFPDVSELGPVPKAALGFYEPQARWKYNPYVQQWSFGIQRQLASSVTAEVSYVGAKGTHLNTRRTPNQPYQYDHANPTPVADRLPFPNFGLIVESFWQATSNYHALNAKLEHQSPGLMLLAAYTWGRSMDDKSAAASVTGDAAGWAGPMNSHRQDWDYARSTYDVNQRLVTSFVYDLPVGRGKRIASDVSGAVDAVIGGWQVNGVILFQGGFPFSIIAQDIDNLNVIRGQRADVNGDPNLSRSARTAARFFDTSVFSQPGRGYFGNSGRNAIRGPGINNFDIGLFKNFSVAEDFRVQFRWESFNAFNHPQYNNPVSNLHSPTFGVITSAKRGRINQFGLKFIW